MFKFTLFIIALIIALLIIRRVWPMRGAEPKPPVKQAGMSAKEARAVLGLEGTQPNNDEVIAAHRRLMQKIHPDKGGSAHLAQQLNQAKSALLEPD